MGFSGEQYVLEKGVYRNCDDWGSGSSALGSLQPVLQVRGGRRSRASWWSGVWSLGGAHFSGGGTRRSKPGAPGGGVSWRRGLLEGGGLNTDPRLSANCEKDQEY